MQSGSYLSNKHKRNKKVSILRRQFFAQLVGTENTNFAPVRVEHKNLE